MGVGSQRHARQLYTQESTSVPEWAPGPVWTNMEKRTSLVPTGVIVQLVSGRSTDFAIQTRPSPAPRNYEIRDYMI